MNVTNKKVKELLKKWASIMNQLREAKVLRSSNNPTGDYAEFFIAKKLKLELMSNATSSYDAIDAKTKKKVSERIYLFLTWCNIARQEGEKVKIVSIA